MKTNKEQLKEYLTTLYNGTSQSPVEEAYYNKLLKHIEETSSVKDTKEYKDLERQWYFADQLNKIYRNRINCALTFLEGKHD